MRQELRSAAILGALVVLVFASGVWGWSAMTRPMPRPAEVPICSMQQVAPGDEVRPDQVVVTVLNAGERQGLASRTMQMFLDEGFAQGERGNAPRGTDVAFAQVWADEPDNPAVELVAAWLGPGAKVVQRQVEGVDVAGVVVLVGDGFQRLARGPESVAATADAEICSPQP